MKIAMIALSSVLSLSLVGLSGCDKEQPEVNEAALANLDVAALSSLLKSDAPPKVYDANSEDTRAEYGVIPGAVLLTSSSDYDADDVLPSNKEQKLVFYCGSTKCQAAEGAATRAMAAGYTNVAVLPEGIKGWSKAGQPTTRVN